LNADVDLDQMYLELQEDLIDVAGEGADAPVPACPGWRVGDVLAHVAGLARDSVEGTVPAIDLLEQWRDGEVAARRDSMTADQVRRADGLGTGEVARSWRALTPRLAPMLRGEVPFPDPAPFGISAILITDLVVHDQDVRGALGRGRAPDGPAAALALATYGFGVDYRIRQLGLPALGLGTGPKVRVLGEGEPGATVSADRFELVRALAGRRSRSQILALTWVGDPGPYLGIIPAYGERPDALEE